MEVVVVGGRVRVVGGKVTDGARDVLPTVVALAAPVAMEVAEEEVVEVEGVAAEGSGPQMV